MKDLLKLYRAKRAAVTTLSPLIEETRFRLGDIPDATWRHPYMIGFMGLLISYVAMDATDGELGDEHLGLTQVDAWLAVTKSNDSSIGEEMFLLSADTDPDFMAGCKNAQRFHAAFCGEQPDAGTWDDGPIPDAELRADPALYGQGGALAAALWHRYFDENVKF